MPFACNGSACQTYATYKKMFLPIYKQQRMKLFQLPDFNVLVKHRIAMVL